MKPGSLLLALLLIISIHAAAQSDEHSIETLFGRGKPQSLGGYGAMTNKFTTINDHYANIVEVYGGWYVNHRFLIGLAVAGATNDIPVDYLFSADPRRRLSYEYGHVGLMTEYVIASRKRVHVALQLFNGAGFTMQYQRHHPERYFSDDRSSDTYDHDWFYVIEPGIAFEVNVFRWMRFTPGVSYRSAINSHGLGLSDDSLSAMSYNLTLKFGKF